MRGSNFRAVLTSTTVLAMHCRWSIWAFFFVTWASACTPPVSVEAPKPTGRVRFRSIVEPSAVRALAAIDGALLEVTEEGILRWNEDDAMVVMGSDVFAGRVVAVAAAPSQHAAWIITDAGIARFDVGSGAIAELAAPNAVGLDVSQFRDDNVAVAPATDGGLWLGTDKGLFYGSSKGGWVTVPVKTAVHALALDRNGDLWIASDQGLLRRQGNGTIAPVESTQGCTITKPRMLFASPTMGTVAIGQDSAGVERLAIGVGTRWQTYGVITNSGPAAPIDAIAEGDNELILLIKGRLYRVTAHGTSDLDPLATDSLRLTLVGSGNAAFSIVAVSTQAPPGATALVRWGKSLMIGTHELGVARYDLNGTRAERWLRRGQMFVDATTLSVACLSATECWVATGARRAWHTNGERFVAGGPDNVVLAVVRAPNGDIWAFHRGPTENVIHVAKINPQTATATEESWTELPKLQLQLPGHAPEISFARFDSHGQLWVGLRFREAQEVHAWGVATINIQDNKVTYHRTTDDAKLRATMLPIPVGVMDGDLRGTDAWFATNEGVARLQGKAVMVWNESNGLQSEFTRAIAVASNGEVFAGTSAGLGVFSPASETWDFPKNASFAVNDVVVDTAGAPWMATERGLTTLADGKVKRLDNRAGLVENSILDLAVDHLGRIWARGPMSLTVVETGK